MSLGLEQRLEKIPAPPWSNSLALPVNGVGQGYYEKIAEAKGSK
jgi:hypothetical protein